MTSAACGLFHPISQPECLEIVDFYFRDWTGDCETLHAEAITFAQTRGVRRFFNSFN